MSPAAEGFASRPPYYPYAITALSSVYIERDRERDRRLAAFAKEWSK